MVSVTTTRGYTLGKSADLEQAWRPLIPVDSFVREPVALKPEVVKPDVGIRWGKPADFDFDLSGLEQKRKRSPMEIREVPRYYFENEILDFTEQWREFKVGDVLVHIPAQMPEYNGQDWASYMQAIYDVTYPDERPKIEIEELTSWITDSGISWERMDSNGDPIANVTVYYEFTVTGYIPFYHTPQAKIDERGEHPDA